jgi:hypothetical protein
MNRFLLLPLVLLPSCLLTVGAESGNVSLAKSAEPHDARMELGSRPADRNAGTGKWNSVTKVWEPGPKGKANTSK